MANSKDMLNAAKAAKKELKEHPGLAAAALTPENPESAREISNAAREVKKRLREEEKARQQAEERANRLAEEHNQAIPQNDGTMMGGMVANQNSKPSYNVKGQSLRYLWLLSVIMQFLLVLAVLEINFFGLIQFRLDSLSLINATIFTYLGIATWAFVSFKDSGLLTKGDIQRLVYFLFISAIYVLLPFYIGYFPDQSFLGLPPVQSWLSFLFYVALPLWPHYIAKHSGDEQLQAWTGNYMNFVIIVTIFIFIWYFATSLNATDIIAAGGRPELVEARSVMDFLVERTKDIWTNIWEKADITTGIKRIVNASGINYYTGVVDDNQDEPVGLFIENVRNQDRYGYVGSPVIIWADIRGKSFTKEIDVVPSCFIEGRTRIDGEPFPNVISLFGLETSSLRCTFNDLPKGSYRAKIQAAFEFETWAYVTYTFVDVDLARAMDLEGRDINRELEIDRIPKAIYTNGPAFLGMGSQVDQPVRIDLQENNRQPILGVALDNRWSDGDISTVNSFTIQVPDDFELRDCDRWYPDKTRPPVLSEDGYDHYEFSREELGFQRHDFTSVTCALFIKDPISFMAGQQKVQRTFATQVNYNYFLTRTLGVSVRE